MNSTENPEFDDRQLDRLVDGELSESEYRRLLVAFDERPGGWRRCALAFLEAQALRKDLASLGMEAERAADGAAATPRQNSRPMAGWISLASAASFLLAFLVMGQLPRNPLGGFGAGAPVTPASGLLTRQESSLPPGLPPAALPIGGRGLPATSPDSAPWGRYRLVVDGENGQPRQIELPVFSADDPRANLLVNDQATMPVELIRELQRMGLQVDRKRRWTPVPSQAGESHGGVPVYVPVEELRITPVSSRSFQ